MDIPDRQSFIDSVEFRKDWGLPISIYELMEYERIIKEESEESK